MCAKRIFRNFQASVHIRNDMGKYMLEDKKNVSGLGRKTGRKMGQLPHAAKGGRMRTAFIWLWICTKNLMNSQREEEVTQSTFWF
jgi:hypothetical protein